jgi:hypothetical protein
MSVRDTHRLFESIDTVDLADWQRVRCEWRALLHGSPPHCPRRGRHAKQVPALARHRVRRGRPSRCVRESKPRHDRPLKPGVRAVLEKRQNAADLSAPRESGSRCRRSSIGSPTAVRLPSIASPLLAKSVIKASVRFAPELTRILTYEVVSDASKAMISGSGVLPQGCCVVLRC